jgi:hypothetical protein
VAARALTRRRWTSGNPLVGAGPAGRRGGEGGQGGVSTGRRRARPGEGKQQRRTRAGGKRGARPGRCLSPLDWVHTCDFGGCIGLLVCYRHRRRRARPSPRAGRCRQAVARAPEACAAPLHSWLPTFCTETRGAAAAAWALQRWTEPSACGSACAGKQAGGGRRRVSAHARARARAIAGRGQRARKPPHAEARGRRGKNRKNFGGVDIDAVIRPRSRPVGSCRRLNGGGRCKPIGDRRRHGARPRCRAGARRRRGKLGLSSAGGNGSGGGVACGDTRRAVGGASWGAWRGRGAAGEWQACRRPRPPPSWPQKQPKVFFRV